MALYHSDKYRYTLRTFCMLVGYPHSAPVAESSGYTLLNDFHDHDDDKLLTFLIRQFAHVKPLYLRLLFRRALGVAARSLTTALIEDSSISASPTMTSH